MSLREKFDFPFILIPWLLVIINNREIQIMSH